MFLHLSGVDTNFFSNLPVGQVNWKIYLPELKTYLPRVMKPFLKGNTTVFLLSTVQSAFPDYPQTPHLLFFLHFLENVDFETKEWPRTPLGPHFLGGHLVAEWMRKGDPFSVDRFGMYSKRNLINFHDRIAKKRENNRISMKISHHSQDYCVMIGTFFFLDTACHQMSSQTE